jgi:hypothetical protein
LLRAACGLAGEGARSEGVQAGGARGAAADGDCDAVERGDPFVLERALDGVLHEVRAALARRCAQPLVGLGDLGVQQREVPVDLSPRRGRDRRQLVGDGRAAERLGRRRPYRLGKGGRSGQNRGDARRQDKGHDTAVLLLVHGGSSRFRFPSGVEWLVN